MSIQNDKQRWESVLLEKAGNVELHHFQLKEIARIRILEATCQEIEREAFVTAHFSSAAIRANERLSFLQAPQNRHISASTMRRLFYLWRSTGKRWQAFIDFRCSTINKAGARTAQYAFRCHLAALAFRHPHSLAAAVRELKQEWDEGKSIPGYDDMEKVPGKYPAGWSEDNLVRKMPKRSTIAASLKITDSGAPE